MASISVLVYFDSKWDSLRAYNAYSIFGIVIPVECSYMKLEEIIMNELKKDRSQFAIGIRYQIIENGPIIDVCRDSFVHFYIQIKKNDSDLMKFPLCVEIENVASSDDNLMCLGNGLTEVDTSIYPQTGLASVFANGCMNTSLDPILPTIEEMGSAICEYVRYPDQNNDEIECNVVFRPSIEEVKVNAFFRNKNLLVTSLALYVIHYHF
ncbi:zinc finger protein [Abeliophyllum distichum]|uniref:Zinc finger protein n=1 Tax=Abeliophyllum distichum TaxID=126358 RepID=A0ABD1SW62_9LAMI